jgi:hypothetical protein
MPELFGGGGAVEPEDVGQGAGAISNLGEIALPTVTALDLIKGALRLIGEAGESETLSAEDARNCLFSLNEMMDLWTLKRFMVHHIKQDLLIWPAGVESQLIGPSGDFDIGRPLKLEPGCFVRDSENQDWPLMILTDREQYDRLCHKFTPTDYPRLIYFKPVFPRARIYLWPPPAVPGVDN